jgi:hypothetical protein
VAEIQLRILSVPVRPVSSRTDENAEEVRQVITWGKKTFDEEVEMVIREWLRMQESSFIAMEFLNSYQDECMNVL